MTKRILFVDDEPRVLQSLRRMLHAQRHQWQMVFVADPEEAWQQLLAESYDAVVTDVKMPRITGLELLVRIRTHPQTQDIPVVIVTGLQDRTLKRRALQIGAADLLSKPLDADELMARLHSALRLKQCQDELRAQNLLLEQKVRERTAELDHSRMDIIWRLGKAAEQRDEETGNHVVRVGFFSRLVAEALGMEPEFLETLFFAAPLHDIGKIGIPDRILFKGGPLSPGEWSVMRQHCYIGAKILREESKIKACFHRWRSPDDRAEAGDAASPLLEAAAVVALGHHEKWDGSGYPRALAGKDIPLSARIVAIADVYDALSSDRPYRSAIPDEAALEWINESCGSHFDPQVHAAFIRALPDIRSIRGQLADTLQDRCGAEFTEHEADLICR